LTLIGGDLSARVVGVVLCPVVAPMLAWVVAAVVITGGFCCRGGALSRGWWRARRVCAGGWVLSSSLSSLSATVVDIVGAAPMVGEGWFDRRTAEIAADRG